LLTATGANTEEFAEEFAEEVAGAGATGAALLVAWALAMLSGMWELLFI
jgi:hypothetical protein